MDYPQKSKRIAIIKTNDRHWQMHLVTGSLWACMLLVGLDAEDWPQNLGPDRNGILADSPLRVGWQGADAPLAWRMNAGLGSSPPVVSGNRVYVIGAYKHGTSVDRLDDPASVPTEKELKEGETATGQDLINRLGDNAQYLAMQHHKDEPMPFVFPEDIRADHLNKPHYYIADVWAQCYDLQSGKRLWATLLSDYTPISQTQPRWPIASPLVVNDKVFFHGPTGDVSLVDSQGGNIIWKRRLLSEGFIGEDGKQANAGGGFLWNGSILIHVRKPPSSQVSLIAFRVTDGSMKWKTDFPNVSFRPHFTRFGYAVINGDPTVLMSLGSATTGVDPESGSIRWSIEVPKMSTRLYQQRFDELKNRWGDDAAIDKTMRRRLSADYAPYPAYSPVCWKNYVMDAVMFGHDDFTSQTWCIRIDGSQPILVWQTLDTVPECHSDKANMIAKDGRLYVFDQNSYAHRGLNIKDNPKAVPEARPMRSSDTGQFQCFDIPTGTMLWSSNAFRTETGLNRDDTDHYKMIFVGENIIVTSNDGVWIAAVHKDGLEVTATANFGKAYTGWTSNMNGEPVFSQSRLFLRQSMPHEEEGYNRLFPGSGNLFCLDLSATNEN